ncbi:Uncharacterized protein BM_BM10265 [Brugia malayi]|uniref:Uncharacterized protein n=1 Tax=Brugia malayi TaxID=6279 RepID=A0A4E9F9S3_BRUMA|nr:Uncharacterized protein BM_BM10265 [Brugia malayi]VIO92797.1 Uncharacterized protein BM_BM10265 [Brugia malayi]
MFLSFCSSLLLCYVLMQTGRTDLLRAGSMQSTLTNETIRECWCEEEDICMKDVELKLQKCLDRCWARDATKVTLRPDDLRQCFIQQKPIVDHLVTCVKSNMKCCADSKYGPQIPKQDIGKIINLTGEKLEEAESKIITNPTLQPIQKVLDAVIEIGKCVKDCAMEGDGLEECFESYTCQPCVHVNRMQGTVRRCFKHVDWRRAVGELCNCTVESGVSGLKNFCPLLNLASIK